MREMRRSDSSQPRRRVDLRPFASAVVDRVRASRNIWKLPGGELLLPEVFGFCRGVERALAMLDRAVKDRPGREGRLVLLGEVIHNPWVNDYFHRRGSVILTPVQRDRLERHISPGDCAVIPAFGVPPAVQKRLRAIGCEVIDTTCGDVCRLWAWAEEAVRAGFAVLIFGRPRHDETVVTKSRLAAAGGRYLVVRDLDEARRFCDRIRRPDGTTPREVFGDEATNAETFEPFERLAQVSQTTMLYGETMSLRRIVREAFTARFGEQADDRLMLQPTVCRATQERQTAATALCGRGLDLAIVIGGFGSSNTRHLYELASRETQAYFIESAGAIRSRGELLAFDPALEAEAAVRRWLPELRRVRIGVLAGASTPESVVGEVLEKLAGFLV